MTSKSETVSPAETDDDENFPPVVIAPLAFLAVSGVSAILGTEADDLLYPTEENPRFMVYWSQGRVGEMMPLVSLLWKGDDLSILVTVEAGNDAEGVLADRIAGYCARRLIDCEIVEEDFSELPAGGYREGEDDQGDDQGHPLLDPSITIN